MSFLARRAGRGFATSGAEYSLSRNYFSMVRLQKQSKRYAPQIAIVHM
jgi:hypothetical protein